MPTSEANFRLGFVSHFGFFASEGAQAEEWENKQVEGRERQTVNIKTRTYRNKQVNM